MVSLKEERPVDRKPAAKSIELSLAGQIAAGLLSGPNVSHRDVATVADLAVKHARAIMDALDKENA